MRSNAAFTIPLDEAAHPVGNMTVGPRTTKFCQDFLRCVGIVQFNAMVKLCREELSGTQLDPLAFLWQLAKCLVPVKPVLSFAAHCFL